MPETSIPDPLACPRSQQLHRRAGVQELAERHQVPLTVSGHPAHSSLTFDHPDAAALQTLLTVRMLDHGILAGAAFYPCLAHGQHRVSAYLTAAEPAIAELAEAIRAADATRPIGGPVKHTGFARLV
jgi:glutamate-1-semialdehyde 2,1-aminomutase